MRKIFVSLIFMLFVTMAFANGTLDRGLNIAYNENTMIEQYELTEQVQLNQANEVDGYQFSIDINNKVQKNLKYKAKYVCIMKATVTVGNTTYEVIAIGEGDTAQAACDEAYSIIRAFLY